MDKIGTQIAGFVSAIIGVAIIAVILSHGSNTVNVIGTFFQGLSQLLSVVISPVTGGGNFATGQSTYAGEIVSPGGFGSGSSYNASSGGFGINLNGLGSIGASGSTISSIAGLFGGSGGAAGAASGAIDSGVFDDIALAAL